MSDEQPESKYKTERWVYLGKRYDADKQKVYHAFSPVVDGVVIATELHYTKDLGAHTVGGHYDMQVERIDDKTSVRLNSARYIALDDDAQQVRTWQAVSYANDVEMRRDQKETKDGRSTIANMTLNEVRQQYRKLPANNARALLSIAISIITRGGM